MRSYAAYNTTGNQSVLQVAPTSALSVTEIREASKLGNSRHQRFPSFNNFHDTSRTKGGALIQYSGALQHYNFIEFYGLLSRYGYNTKSNASTGGHRLFHANPNSTSAITVRRQKKQTRERSAAMARKTEGIGRPRFSPGISDI